MFLVVEPSDWAAARELGASLSGWMHAERLAGDQRIALDAYAVITSPSGEEYLKTTPVVAGYPVMIADKLTNLKSSTEVSDNKAYCGAWQMLTIAIWGGLEIQIDPYMYALTNQLRLVLPRKNGHAILGFLYLVMEGIG